MADPDNASLEYQLKNGKVTLRDYIVSLLRAERELMMACMKGDMAKLEGEIRSGLENIKIILEERDKAILLQDALTVERLETHNKWREQVNQERGDYVRREDLARLETAVALRSEVVDKALGGFDGRLSSLDGRWIATTAIGGFLIGASGLGLTILMFLLQ
jgi:hypothetical protein